MFGGAGTRHHHRVVDLLVHVPILDECADNQVGQGCLVTAHELTRHPQARQAAGRSDRGALVGVFLRFGGVFL